MRFSIIIPVYNVEKYIDKCMDTVMHQTFDDYEVMYGFFNMALDRRLSLNVSLT